jgi:Flp pilus assembly protein TadD
MLANLLLGVSLLAPQIAAIQRDESPLDLNPEIRLYLDNKVNRADPPMLRLQALVATVFRDNELHFTYSGATRSAIETFATRNGNCLSFTILFIAAARHVGLDARFREVEIAPTWSQNGIFISLNQHVNAAVYIDGVAYAIDVFPAINRIEIGSSPVSDGRGFAHYYNNLGVQALGNSSFQDAELFLNKALEMDPTTAGVWINLGAAKAQAGQLLDAEKCYRKALALDARNPAAMSNLAGIFAVTDRLKEANSLQQKIRKFREQNPYHHFSLGQQAFNGGRYQEAIVHYRKALKLKPGEHNFYFALARSYSQLGLAVDAETNLQLAMKYSSDPANKSRYSQKLDLLKGIRNQSPGIH